MGIEKAIGPGWTNVTGTSADAARGWPLCRICRGQLPYKGYYCGRCKSFNSFRTPTNPSSPVLLYGQPDFIAFAALINLAIGVRGLEAGLSIKRTFPFSSACGLILFSFFLFIPFAVIDNVTVKAVGGTILGVIIVAILVINLLSDMSFDREFRRRLDAAKGLAVRSSN